MPSPAADPSASAPTRRYRATVRTRLALTYSALLTGAGLIMLALVYVFMRFVPTYELGGAATAPAPATPAIVLPPVPGPGTGAEPAVVTTPANELLITSADQMLKVLLVVSAVVLLVLAVAGVAVGWVVAGRMLRPLRFINEAVGHAAHGDLEQRIRLTGPRDEISELATNFDEMLAQLERSFAASRRFASNASHELLTPLATTRAMLDVAIAERDDPSERIIFDRLRTMNERSIETAESLLVLAKIEASTNPPQPVDLRNVVTEVVELCAEEAAERRVTITLDFDEATVEGDPVLARQMVMNLIQNAIRHNLAIDGFATVTTRSIGSDGHVVLTVENSGAPLEDSAVAELTEPFVRAAGRRSTSTRGHGLGLSIVAAIVTRFHGELELQARPGGGLSVSVTM